jgi:DNA helicase-2/ATP-dependent DNA helicase PcrA
VTERTYPSDAASALLARFRERSRGRLGAATPVDALARLLELDVATFDAALHPGVWGYLEPGEDLIFLRAGLPEAARRFTLAHEIGHAVLHRGSAIADEILGASVHLPFEASATLPACQASDVESLDIFNDETLSPGQAYSARSAVEQEANAFAVALLMPEALFLETYLALCARPQTTSARGSMTRLLAKRFGVSEDAALRRLQWLLAPEGSKGAIGNAKLAISWDEDPEQRDAARLDAPALVMAGPGSGKTSTLVARIKHLIEERGVNPDAVLVLTFSRKATEELRERVRGVSIEAGARGTPNVSTIHRFCFDLLGRYGHFIGLPSEIRLASELELYFLLRQVMREAHLRYLSSPFAPDLYVRDIQQAISRAKDDLISPDEVMSSAESASQETSDETRTDMVERQQEFALIYKNYQHRLRDQQIVDYGDVIALTVRLLREQGEVATEVAARWPHLLVDEYQDINHAMGAVIRELVSAGCGLWAVGDADQAIYRFRGAEPGIVHRFGEVFPGAYVVSLVRNYRSRRTILDAASVFAGEFSQINGRLPLEATRIEEAGSNDSCVAVRVATAGTGDDELAGLARAIEERHQSGRAYHDQVVLLRTRRQVEQVATALDARGIPTYTLASAIDRDIVKRCIAALSLFSEPSGAGLIRAGLQTSHAFTRDDAIVLLRESRRRRKAPLDMLLNASGLANVSPPGRVAMRRLGRILSILRSAPSVATGISLYCFSLTHIGAELLMDRERRAIDAVSLQRLLDLARAFDSWRAVDASTAGARADWVGFAEFLRAASVLRLDTLNEIPSQGVDAVRVMTAHASKGLEFPIVYLPQLANRRFPLSGRRPVVERVGQASDSAADDNGSLSDEASLFYVAMTRARDELILSYARRYGRASYTISPFLPPIRHGMGERIAYEQWGEATEATEATDREQVVRGAVGEQALPQLSMENSSALFELSELETYQRCPKQYAYRYVDHLWAPSSLVSLFSRAIRRAASDVAQAINQSRLRGMALPSRDEALKLVDERWRTVLEEEERTGSGSMEGLRNAVLEAYYLRQAKITIESLWKRLTQRGHTSDGLNELAGEARFQQVTISIGALQIRGEIETVSTALDFPKEDGVSAPGRSADSWVVTRYRSSRSDNTPSLRDLFVEIAAQHEALGGGQGHVIARNLATGSVAQVKLTERQRARVTREVMGAASGIMRRDFHPKPDEWQCQRCPFVAACPE